MTQKPAFTVAEATPVFAEVLDLVQQSARCLIDHWRAGLTPEARRFVDAAVLAGRQEAVAVRFMDLVPQVRILSISDTDPTDVQMLFQTARLPVAGE